MVRILFFMALLLAAMPSHSQGTLTTVHSGLTGGYSSQMRVSQHRHFTVYAQAMVIQRGANVVHTVSLSQAITEGSLLRIDSAWSFGRELHWDRVRPDRTCGGLRCTRNMGVLAFSAAEFAQYAETGLTLQLLGSQGPIDLALPAGLFVSARMQAAAAFGRNS